MVGGRRKIKKKHWLKRPRRAPKKRHLNQNIQTIIQTLMFGILFFENSISGIQSFYICPDVSMDII